jgi:hypothetical protein
MLLILELMDRGYRVAISTHSASVLEVVWALRQLQARGAHPRNVRDIFGLDKARWDIDELARRTLQKDYRVFYLDYVEQHVVARDISTLDPGAADPAEGTWGDLLGLSVRANAVVAAVSGEVE